MMVGGEGDGKETEGVPWIRLWKYHFFIDMRPQRESWMVTYLEENE